VRVIIFFSMLMLLSSTSFSAQYECGTTGLIDGYRKFYVGPSTSSYQEARESSYRQCQGRASSCKVIVCYDVYNTNEHTCDSTGLTDGYRKFYTGETKRYIDDAAKSAYLKCQLSSSIHCDVTSCR